MNIRDIVNRNIINLSNCDEEPIHIPGTIQPHGFLLAVDNRDFRIQFCSENVKERLGAAPQEVLNKPFNSFVSEADFSAFQKHISIYTNNSQTPIIVTINSNAYHLLAHQAGALWILEFEPASAIQQSEASIFDQTIHFVKYMEQSHSLQQLCQKVAEEIRRLNRL